MIKTAVYTYYDNPTKPTWSGFSSLKDLQDFVTLSVSQSKKHIGKTKLVCNKFGASRLSGCGFDVIEPYLDGFHFNEKFWAYPKIVTYALQTEPFLHIDLDALLWERPSDEFLNAPIVFQNIELFSKHVGYKQLIQRFKNSRSGLKKLNTSLNYAYCCGFVGGNNLDYFQEWKQLVDEFIVLTDFNKAGWNGQNHFFEQYFCASLAFEKGLANKAKFLCGQEIYSKTASLPFAHLWGNSKKSRETIDKCINRVAQIPFIKDIPKYFLTYPDNTERLGNANANIKKHGFLNAQIEFGVNPDKDDVDLLISQLEIRKESDLPKGNLGSFLAHRRLWKKCKKNDWSMIVEDDAFFRPDWKKKLSAFFDNAELTDKPTVIKLCVFDNESMSNETPPKASVKVSDDCYKLLSGLSAVCYIANKAYFQLVWDKCNTINGKTQDWLTQEVYLECDVYGFFPNIVVNAKEYGSMRNSNNKLGGWSISQELLEDLLSFPKGTKMVELGSGEGTKHLVKHFNLTSIEQNSAYLNLHHDNYIYAPIKDNWFDLSAFKDRDLSCEVLLVDAPFGASRRGVIDNFKLFNATTVIFDDVNRDKDMSIAKEFCDTYNYKMIIKGTDKKHAICKTQRLH